MAILSVHEHRSLRGCSVDEQDRKEYNRAFIVVCDGAGESLVSVRDHTSLPAIGDAYPQDAKAKCVSKTPRSYGEDGRVWLVEVRYVSTPRLVNVTPRARPWMKTPKVHWGTHVVRRSIAKDMDSNAILNSAGDPFDPPVEREVHYPALTITRYERNYVISNAMDYIDKINQFGMTIAGLVIEEHQALITKYEGTNVEVDGVKCWEVNYEILFDKDGWQVVLLDAGYYYLSGGSPKRFADKDGDGKIDVGLLDGSGGQLASGAEKQYKSFRVYLQKDFGPLGLDFTLSGT